MIIDAHVHIVTATDEQSYFPWRQPWHIAMEWAYSDRPPYTRDPKRFFPRQQVRYADPDGSLTMKNMDEQGIDAAVVLPIDYDLAFSGESDISIETKHEQLGEMMRKWPGRIYAYAGPDPRRTDALDIFKRAIDEHGLVGLKVIPGAGFYPWDERLYPMYEICQDRGLPVSICTEGTSANGYKYTRFCEPIHVGDMMADFPDLKVNALHGGFPWQHWFEESLTVGEHINAFIQIDEWIFGVPYRGSGRGMNQTPNMFTNEEALVTMLARARDVIGAHKIVWGTDTFHGPAFQGDHSCWHIGWRNVVDWVRKLPETAQKYGKTFTDEEVDLILGGNSARTLGIEKKPEWDVPYKFGWARRYPSPNIRGA